MTLDDAVLAERPVQDGEHDRAGREAVVEVGERRSGILAQQIVR